MGAKAARLGDIGSGHGCFPPTPIISASSDVIIENIPAARQGDALLPHGCSNCPPHPRAIAGGAGSVLINGMPAARLSDNVDCGGVITSGAGTVFIGDSWTSSNSTTQIMPSFNRYFILRNKAGKVLANIDYKLSLDDGTSVQGTTDQEGKTKLISSGQQSSTIKVYIKGS
jgi:uncharacterized Zn-binding protein involved in type VI secretion